MREALTILGLGPCHHMFEVGNDPVQKALWRRKVGGEDIAWAELLNGYRSCVDWPSSHYWRELSQTYPKAKVILTIRDAEDWWTSYSKTILNPIVADRGGQTVGWKLIGEQVMGGRPEDRDTAIRAFEQNTRAVRAALTPDRLLEYRPGDGWGPLCAFLGVPVPEVPYPSRNSTADFQQRQDS